MTPFRTLVYTKPQLQLDFGTGASYLYATGGKVQETPSIPVKNGDFSSLSRFVDRVSRISACKRTWELPCHVMIFIRLCS